MLYITKSPIWPYLIAEVIIMIFITKKLKNLVDSVRYVCSKTSQIVTNEVRK